MFGFVPEYNKLTQYPMTIEYDMFSLKGSE